MNKNFRDSNEYFALKIVGLVATILMAFGMAIYYNEPSLIYLIFGFIVFLFCVYIPRK